MSSSATTIPPPYTPATTQDTKIEDSNTPSINIKVK